MDAANKMFLVLFLGVSVLGRVDLELERHPTHDDL
jgi:hypothetical protein